MGQAEHYDNIIDDYERHYYDAWSMKYRREFIFSSLFRGLDLNGRRVADLACGTGHNTVECLKIFPKADIFGVDISPKSCEAYRINTGRPAYVMDLTAAQPDKYPRDVDVAMIVGGLHHCVNNLEGAIKNLANILKPGGHLLMVEPNSRFVLNSVRNLWYRNDTWFRVAEEAPLDHDKIAETAVGIFDPIQVDYLGGVAYFAVLNSLILRLPHRVKNWIAPALFSMDRVYNKQVGKAPFPMFIAQWKRV